MRTFHIHMHRYIHTWKIFTCSNIGPGAGFYYRSTKIIHASDNNNNANFANAANNDNNNTCDCSFLVTACVITISIRHREEATI